jgi:DNA replication and repair protein RecF
MKIVNFNVSTFRNLKQLNLKPSEQVNLFYGDNAQGKTNILEAIYYLSIGRSFRAKHYSDYIPS